jgi:hypothetical protein
MLRRQAIENPKQSLPLVRLCPIRVLVSQHRYTFP